MGASSGIGKATALYFAAQGWDVIATMRIPEVSTFFEHEKILAARLDVQDQSSIAEAIAAGIGRFGKTNVLINNAGYSLSGIFESLPPKKIQEQFAVNVFGVMDVTRATLPPFRARKAGIIINVSSRAGLIGLPMISLYCASKFALEGFSEALAFELAPLNILVKIVEPSGGITNTNFAERVGQETVQIATPNDYKEFAEQMRTVFGGMQAARETSAEEIAKDIYNAATDGTDRLRYFVGEDVGGFVQAKHELPDQQYIDFMRRHFKS